MTDGSSDMKQSRRTDLTSLLDLEVLNVDFFRSTHARLPRGVIGTHPNIDHAPQESVTAIM
jgi:hypothetical protein